MNYFDRRDRRRREAEAEREYETVNKIKAAREARRRELDAPARLAFKRRQLDYFRSDGQDPERVSRLEREVADLEVEVLRVGAAPR